MMRKKIGFFSALIGFIFLFYLLLGLCGIVPLLTVQLFGITLLHFTGQCSMLCFVISAWGYWKI